MKFDVKNLNQADRGISRIAWADRSMPVLQQVRDRFKAKKPLKKLRIAACLHVTTETANLMRTLKDGGANVRLCASNPLSTQDDVAAALVKKWKIPTFAITGASRKKYYDHLNATLDFKPQITMDDGADLVSLLHSERKNLAVNVKGSTEETTTGVIRLKSMAKNKVLKFPVVAVNDADTKHLFDNRYGTGQSTIDGILRATNILLAGQKFIVAGYGMCGRGVAMRARGMGAHVVITEVDPTRALEAHLDGYEVMSMEGAAKVGDVFVTVTGNTRVIRPEHFRAMKNGAIIANSGHFDVEIDIAGLKEMTKEIVKIRDYVEEYKITKDQSLFVLGEGRLINLAAAEGHPAQVMDMSFANQALAAEYIAKSYRKLKKQVYPVPADIDKEIARLKLQTLGISIDKLTKEQQEYLASWQLGT
ncbi:adenosylhomocysteinase [Patescibacteria group bacterium]|nr:adenosylhomocysteinase [Patescibacteria group bacterium]